ncbi:irregular chiasm C-roughest protein-like isoform X1 [Anopheles stephensi]|uniref:irregular chiasm C-roughest protein-like isoform X1 n=1 Tax=Anopheles stephensi TaxID=30069 RepID=UPI001658C210|nr:irregular chiasm C-roughest protein-like isoform X1 [Anopheles stephensi]XP_035899963.1 irregular chiasm C-roughest protein-like isoform X1 [Anopheles stephensi]XP_035899971.1 irregular chiasm C-roughest protein-like isoform X1 [Anopheles stephensi]XP_035899980.1 irregular chiasm C-roughest protein-like isoform X1 [Anopheles stephensi]XP_035899989.1 irregular chiasm C-roughest protein-like isoform X1 [Anopheles stephensi]
MARSAKTSLRYVVLVHATVALLLSRTVLTAAKSANGGGGAGGSSGGASGSGSANGVQKFAMEPQDQTAIVGSRVTLPCRVESKVGQLQWTKDDFGLGWHRNLSGFDRYSMVGSDEEGDYSLEIYPVMLDDEALYQCQVGRGKDGTPGIRSRFAKLTVLVPPEPPKIVQGDFLVTTEDREIELECVSVGGKPAAEITWIDGLGNVLTSGIEYVKEPMTDTGRFTAKSILKLTPKKEHHNTSFTCQAQNTADRTYRSVKLKLEVKYAPKVSVSVIGGALSGGRIPEGAEVRLSCRADANPSEVTYKWYKADEPILGDYTTEMVIHNVTKEYHDAVIKCEVHNAVGKSEESEILDISYGPTFRTRPQSVETDIDRKVTLTCDVDGNPPPEIIWVHEDTTRIVSNSANITLMATRETAGNYYCKASVRGFPDIEASAAIHLKGPPAIRSPRQQYGSMNDNAQIQCDAISIPKAKQVIWTYNGLELTSENDHTILENSSPEGVRSTLIISKSQRQHFGVYNCTVLNEYGSDSLEIQFAPMESSSLPVVILIVVCVFITIVFALVVSLCCCERKGNKKLPPADVITDQHYMTEKCKESDRSSNVSDLKIDRDHEYSETCSGTDSIATRLAMNMMGSSSGGSNNSGGGGGGGAPVNGGGGGVPLAGPVRIPNDYRYSGDYSDGIGSSLQAKIGQSNGGYVPYVDYAPDYNLPMHISSNGQLPNGNLSLTRNRELRQDNGLPSIQSGMGSLSAGLMNTSLMNAPSIDPRYSATYGNPYLRSSSSHLPPLPPPSTANPALTPAPPPYSAGRHPTSALLMGVNIGVNSGSVIGIGSSLTSPESIRSTSAGSDPNSTMQQQAQQQQQQQGGQLAGCQTGSPAPGQFILPANGDIRKGALATHV